MLAKLLLPALIVALCSCAPEGPTAFVDLNLAVTADCEVTLEGSVVEYVGRGRYDVNAGVNGYCRRDYLGNLRVNSLLRSNSDTDLGRAEPNILQVHRAEITLRTQNNEVILFADDAGSLPNPFAQVVNVSLAPSSNDNASVASLQIPLIPASYDEFLARFVDETVIAEVQLFGTTTGDVDVDFKAFPFPIRICDGCMTGCISDFTGAEESREQVLTDVCDDDSGQDGRVCFDREC